MNPGDERTCSGRVSSSCFTSGTRRVTLVTNPVISHECLFNNMFAYIF
jgi:hypothetical protein